MRTIGRKNIKLIKQLVREEIKANRELGGNGIRDIVMEKIPDNIFFIWESAQSEIERIIHDEIFANN